MGSTSHLHMLNYQRLVHLRVSQVEDAAEFILVQLNLHNKFDSNQLITTSLTQTILVHELLMDGMKMMAPNLPNKSIMHKTLSDQSRMQNSSIKIVKKNS